MNNAELQARIASYLHRGDLTADIPGFIELAESRINSGLRALENEAVRVVPMTSASTPLPDDYAEMNAIEVAQNRGPRTLERVPPSTFTRHQSQGLRLGGGPRWFTVQAQAFAVTPFSGSPAEPLDATLTYWFQFPPLVNDDDTNVALTRWPQLYLLASLIEAYWFIGQPSASADSLQRFVDEITIINSTAEAAKWGAAPAIHAG